MYNTILGAYIVIAMTVVGLGLVYYGLKNIISRKAPLNHDDGSSEHTVGRAVLKGTGLLVLGTGYLAIVIWVMVSLFF